MSNKNSISYRRVGDYNIPNLMLPPEEAKVRLGKWGMLYKDYLFNNKKVVFSVLLAEGKLYKHCADIEKYATETLGMVKSSDVIKHYVNVNGGDEIEINENVGESTYLGAVLDSLKTSVGKIYE